MKKTFLQLGWIFASLLSLPTFADQISLEPLLNKVTLQLHSEQWITTQSALVNIAINAAVTDQDIVSLQNQVMQKLKQISSKGEWHILSLNRQQDKSGLETIQIIAQARLAQNELGNLREKAKAISKPGETYTVENIQFNPTDDEIRQTNVALRNNIYQQAKSEIDTLNKLYPDQKYYIHDINFLSAVVASPMPMVQNALYMRVADGATATPPLSIGNKADLQATVVLAAMPQVLEQKLTHG